jgi:hypothetical protein
MGAGQKLDHNAIDRQSKRTNKITQMKQRIEKKKLQEMVALQKIQASVAAREQEAIENPPLTTEELINLFSDSGVALPSSDSENTSSKKKKKGKGKK